MGAGKSSLLYAVEMALFGVAEVDAAFLVRHGTSHAEVGVTLGEAEHTYSVRRRFRRVRRRGRQTFEPERLTYAEDGSPASYSATEIRQRVIDLLGFPDNPNPHAHSDLWRWAIYVPQERMREILATDVDERLETVRKALGVEKFRTAADNAQALAADLKLSARRRREEAGRMAHWDVEFAEVTREADRLRADRAAFQDAVSKGETALAAARSGREAQEAAQARLEGDLRELDGLSREDAADVRVQGDLQRRHLALSAELEAARRERASLRGSPAEREKLRASRHDAEETVRRLRSELDRQGDSLKSLARATADLQAAERRLAELSQRLQESELERERAVRALAALAEAGPAREPPAPTPRTVSEIEALLATSNREEHEAVERLSRLEASLGQLDELLSAGVCPTCHQTVRAEEFGPHRREVDAEVVGARAERARRSEARAILENERKSRERFERAHERWVDLSRQRAEAQADLARREATVRSANASKASAAQEVDLSRSEVERWRPAEAEGARLRGELELAERRLNAVAESEETAARAEERLRAAASLLERLGEEEQRLSAESTSAVSRRAERARRLASLRGAEERRAELARAIEAARTEERATERRLAEAQEALVRSDTRLDGLVERQASAERGRAERAALVQEATELDSRAAWVSDAFRIAVLRMEKELLAHAQVAFDRAFSRFFASLVDDPSLIARTDVTFTPEVTIAGEATPAEALSGGERTSLALAFRLALARVVRSLGAVRLETLLLDEPTDGFSAEQVVRMGELLEELALPQVIVVSHESQLTGIADRTVRVVKTDGRSSLQFDERSADEGPTPSAAGSTDQEPMP